MKNSLLAPSWGRLSIGRGTIALSLRTAALFILAVAASWLPAFAQTAHFSGVQLPISTVFSAEGIAVDQAGNVYIADEHDKEVLKETPSPAGYVQSVVVSGLGSVNSVAVDTNGNVYACDNADLQVLKESPFGDIYVESKVGINLNGPEWVAVDASGVVYISLGGLGPGLGSVIKEVPSGIYYDVHTVATGLNDPFGIAIDGSGNVFIADSGNNRVLKETLSGSTYTQSTVVSGVNSPGGVAVDAHGNVYISIYLAQGQSAGQILKETPSGNSYVQSVVPLSPWLYLPNDVKLDAAGNLYLSDAYNSGIVYEISYTGANLGESSLGSAISVRLLQFTFDSPGTLGRPGVSVLTEGAGGGDFANVGSGTCKEATYYAAGESCTVYVQFTPSAPGTRQGAVTLYNNAGTTFDSAYLFGVGTGPQSDFVPGTEKAVPYSNSGEASPYGVAVDGAGDVFISDANNNRILKETLTGGTYTESSIGSGLNSPGGIALDGAGNLYIADTGNNRVVEERLSNGGYVQSTLVTGLNTPEAVAVDVSGSLYIADTFNNRILKETLSGGTYVQGTVPILALMHPFGVAVDGSGRILVSDTGNNRVMSVVPLPGGTIQETILASDLNTPFGAAADAMGNAYFADYGASAVLKETANPDGTYSFGILPSVVLSSPYAIAVDGKGNAYIADVGAADMVLEDYSDPPTLSFATTADGATSTDSPKTVTVANGGNQTLSISAVSYPTDFPEAAGVGTDCTGSTDLAPLKSCTLSIEFSPLLSSATNLSTALSEQVSLTDNNLGGFDVVQSVTGNGTETAPPLPPAMTAPAAGSTLTGPKVTFTWSPGRGNTSYQLRIGTTGPGSEDIYASGPITVTSLTFNPLPTNGGELFVRLYYESNNVWTPIDYTYVESGTPVAPVLTSPTPGTVLPGPIMTFGWTTGSGITAYQFRVGTTGVGSSNIYASGVITTPWASVVGIPTVGATLNVRLYYEVDTVWHSTDYLYSEYGTFAPPALTSPAPGSTLTGASAMFSWTAGSEVTLYQLRIGNTGVGSSNLYASGAIAATAVNVTGLPANGGELFVRLYYESNNVWTPIDYTYVESGTATPPAMTSPAPGTELTGSSVTFNWTAGAGITAYQLRIGNTGVGSSNVFASGVLTTNSALVANLPTDGSTLYVRLYYEVAAVWKSIDYVYSANGTPAPPALTSPAPGSTLTGSSAAFTWSSGSVVTAYQLRIGTTGVGSENVYASGAILATSANVTGLPANGGQLFVRLYYESNNVWTPIDYVYTESGTPVAPALNSPPPGTTLSGSSVMFGWTAGAGITAYQLRIGTTGAGSSNLYASGVTTGLSENVTGLPTTGGTVYVRLYYEVDAVWKSIDYTYTAP